VRLRRARDGPRRHGLRLARGGGGRLRRPAACDDAPLGAARAAAGVRRRGQRAPRTAEALPVEARAVPGARAVLRARPARPDRAAAAGRRGRRRARQAPRRGSGRGQRRDARALAVRRGRLGRLPVPVGLQRAGLRADHRPGAPAAAGAPGARGTGVRRLQLRAAQGRLPPARRAGAVLPLQRRQRRGHVLRRRRLRGAQGLRHRARLDLAAPGRARARAAARGRGGLARRGVLRRAGRHGRHLPAARARRGRRACEDDAYAWTWAR
jgi:hypothetical protein